MTKMITHKIRIQMTINFLKWMSFEFVAIVTTNFTFSAIVQQ